MGAGLGSLMNLNLRQSRIYKSLAAIRKFLLKPSILVVLIIVMVMIVLVLLNNETERMNEQRFGPRSEMTLVVTPSKGNK